MKKILHIIQALALAILMTVFRLLPLDAASAAGGFIGRAVGPRLAASRKARRNLELAMPELTESERKKILAGMWDNLGRVIAEYPHLEKIARERVTFRIDEKTVKFVEADKPCILITGHLANWEIAGSSILFHLKRSVDGTYRAPNNPFVDRMLMKARSVSGRIRVHPKSRKGGQDAIRALREGRDLGILIDQKYNEGVAFPFFGQPAMTNHFFASISQKFDYPLIPVQIERVKGARFNITFHEPLATQNRTTEEIIEHAHNHLERWIRKNPEQWLWLHRRWDSEKLKENAKDTA